MINIFQSNMTKIGKGPYYKSQSKEGHKEDNYHWVQKNNSRLKQSAHKQLTQVRSLDNETKNHDFGSSGMSSSTSDLRRIRGYAGNESMRASSVSDLRSEDKGERVYIAKVRADN
jgi:hypothetical protein